jgi:hypothetical protein
MNGSDGGDSATGTPGTGGSAGFQAGDGGDATAGTEDGGAGGDAIIDAGGGGASDGGSPGQAGRVSIGETKAGSIASGSGSTPWLHAGPFEAASLEANSILLDGASVATEDYVDTAVAGLVPTSRTITAGTGLSGGGDLSTNRTLTVSYGTTSTTACVGNDSRLSDSRAPTGSAGGDLGSTYPNPTVTAIHETSGPTKLTFGSISDGQELIRSGSTIVGAARVPTSRTITAGTGLTGGGDLSADRTLTVSYGTSSTTACVGNDSRVTGALQTSGGTMTGQLIGTPSTTTYASTRTFDVSTNNDWRFTDTWTGNITITLSNGSEGCQGVIWAKQDGTGSRTVAFTTSGRTQLMDDGITAYNTSIAAANKVFGMGYYYATIGGTAYVIFSLIPLKAFA